MNQISQIQQILNLDTKISNHHQKELYRNNLLYDPQAPVYQQVLKLDYYVQGNVQFDAIMRYLKGNVQEVRIKNAIDDYVERLDKMQRLQQGELDAVEMEVNQTQKSLLQTIQNLNLGILQKQKEDYILSEEITGLRKQLEKYQHFKQNKIKNYPNIQLILQQHQSNLKKQFTTLTQKAEEQIIQFQKQYENIINELQNTKNEKHHLQVAQKNLQKLLNQLKINRKANQKAQFQISMLQTKVEDEQKQKQVKQNIVTHKQKTISDHDCRSFQNFNIPDHNQNSHLQQQQCVIITDKRNLLTIRKNQNGKLVQKVLLFLTALMIVLTILTIMI